MTVLIIFVAIAVWLITVIIYKGKEKKISVTVMSDNRKQADKLFSEQLANKIPTEFLKVIKHSNGTTEFQLKIKK